MPRCASRLDRRAGFALCLAASCSLVRRVRRTREVEKDLKIVDVQTGWYDAGIVGGQNKLVPSISLKLQNVSDESISRVQICAVFRRVGEDKTWGEHFVRAIGAEGLAAGARPAARSCCARRSATPGRSRGCRCCRTASSSTPRSRCSASTARARG